MSRKPRLHIPGASYHVILRGNARDDIFFDDEDRCRFYLLLQEGVERFEHHIHAFCLMTNHVHLAVQVGEVPLSKVMQNVSFRYTRWVNWRKSRTGHLFQGRYKAFLIDTDEYLLQLVRYIHLNPVRAGLVTSPGDYPWSSQRAYIGKEVLPWLTTDWTLSQFASTVGKARQGFASFIADGVSEGHRPEFHGRGMIDSRCIGEDWFVEQTLLRAETRCERMFSVREVISEVCKVYGIATARLLSGGRLSAEARGVAALLVLQLHGCNLVDLAAETARDPSSLSSAARRVTERAGGDGALAMKISELQSIFAVLQA
jgi:REP element-mobilizing transposase RayT